MSWYSLNQCLQDGGMNGYQKKKYICKLIYIHLLGYDVDFGHMEAVNMLSSTKYTEKQIVSLHVMSFQHYYLSYTRDT